MEHTRLGVVVAGSLVEGLRARLDAQESVEDMRVGKFVRVSGEKHEFFCLVTDVELGSTNLQVMDQPPDPEDGFLRQVLAGTATYGAIAVQPMMMFDRSLALNGQVDVETARSVKTVPVHFSPVFLADEADFERVFGAEDEKHPNHFEIGRPLDMDVPVCLDLRQFVERSNGVFGKSGTGKSFLTRLILAGVVRSRVAVNLIFDMHSEYGWSSQSESDDRRLVKGLWQLFQSQVAVFTVDERSAQQREVRPTMVHIGLDEIEVEDIALLQDELKLNPTAVEHAHMLVDVFGSRWISQLLEMDQETLQEFCNSRGAHPQSLSALRRKLSEVQRLDFVRSHVESSAVDSIVGHLERGVHVVLEFGHHRGLLPYMLVANVLSRRIHQKWVEKTERYKQSQRPADEPPQLMITIEEAHRFLNSHAANQTIFGTIARELRKFYVTLLVVDQRPSGIDDEVLSQIGTRVTCQLNDERDIDAILAGMRNRDQLRSVLSTLESRQQALLVGHAAPMPVIIRTRLYDEDFYRAMTVPSWSTSAAGRPADEYERLFGVDP
jgi:DNA helicase HerA-like ATPase